MNREQCIGLMIRLEGGYVNRADDPGGATKYGITQATLTSFRSTGHSDFYTWPTDVKDLTPAQATLIYEAVDWEAIQGDDLPPVLAALVLNSAVNQGEPTAVALLQECVKVPVDFRMGPRTLEAVKAWRSPYMPEQTLAEEYAAHVGVKYASLYAKEGQFELGWLRRLFRVYTLAVSS